MGLFHFNKRPLMLLGAGACCGVYISTGESWYWAVLIMLLLGVMGAVCKTSARLLAIFVGVCLLFSIWGLVSSRIYDKSYGEFTGEEVTVTGRVTSVDAYKERYTLVTVRPQGVLKRKIKAYLFDNQLDFMQGDRIVLTGRIKKPEAASNPGGYDSRKLLYGDGISAIVFCSQGDVEFIEGISPGHLFGMLRRDIRIKCCRLLGEKNGNLLNAMLVGDKTLLDPMVKEDFKDSGLSHTMAVSGSHVAYILVPLYFLFSRMGIERRKYYPWLIVLLILFAILAGMQPSVLRAGLTAAILLAGGIIDRNPEALNSLAASAILLLLANPFSLYDAGFILSYTSVLSILLFYKPIVKMLGGNPVSAVVSMSLAVQAGILPVTAKLFYSMQIFSIFANILVFPVRAVLSVLGWIMYIVSNFSMPLAKILSFPAGIMADAMASSAELFSGSVWSVINLPYIHPMVVAVYYIALWLLLYKKKNKLMYPAIGGVIICLYFLFLAIPTDSWIFLDSGQADCIIIKTSHGRDILVDTGRYTQGNTIAHFTGDYIDSIFLSHAHEDHIGGLAGILDRFRVGVVYIPGCRESKMDEVIELCTKAGVPCVELVAGDSIEADGCRIDILNPVDCEYLSLNDTSMVIKLTCKESSLLLCGDAERVSEIDMLHRNCDLSADVIKVPHHGAKNSAEPDFLRAVGAVIAIITCGPDDLKHPDPKTLERLTGCVIYRSDIHGAVVIRHTKDGYKVNTEMK